MSIKTNRETAKKNLQSNNTTTNIKSKKAIENLNKEIKYLKSRKKYGLVWEDKSEQVVELCKEKLPVLQEDKAKEIKSKDESPHNFLIEGDNYHALSVLNYTHKNSIDVIYIDPPFNTGARDWKYNNNYVDGNDNFRHSKWISMMSHRLRLCKQLLKKDGVLIIAIDDNELCTLGMLVDELFPGKIRNTVVISINPHGVSRSGFSRTHEYAFFLLNSGQTVNQIAVPPDVRTINLRRSGNNSLRIDSPTMFYPIYIHKKTFQIIKVGQVPDNKFHPKKQTIVKKGHFEIWPIDAKGVEKNWYYSRNRVSNFGNKELKCKKVKDLVHVFFQWSNEGKQKYKTIWNDKKYDAGIYGATLVSSIVKNKFPFPKSIHTTKDCLKAVDKNKDAVILDFFAGSGTTGHAVLELNREDGGNRRFILSTNNENGIAQKFCYPRIKKVIKGYKDDDKQIKGLGGKLKYFHTTFVPAELTDKNKKNLVDKSTEMLCLKEDCFEAVKSSKDFKIFTNNQGKYLGIIYDDKGIDPFKKEIKKLKKHFTVYVFSLDDSAREEEFEEVQDLVELKPIPAVILNVYKRIFR